MWRVSSKPDPIARQIILAAQWRGRSTRHRPSRVPTGSHETRDYGALGAGRPLAGTYCCERADKKPIATASLLESVARALLGRAMLAKPDLDNFFVGVARVNPYWELEDSYR